MSLAPAAVEICAVRKRFGANVALHEASFRVEKNAFFTLLGPSGCGKTTLLRMIAGFEAPDDGAILLNGANIQQLPPHRRRVNTVFQSYALFPHMTIARNIAYGLENLKLDRRTVSARVDEMLAAVHLEAFADRLPEKLSGGQRQRVALARALAPRPELLLLDEPLSALDLKLRQAMRAELRRIQRQTGITFVFVTHDQEEALEMSDRICVLGEGEVQQIDAPRDIYENPANRFVADFVGDASFVAVRVLCVEGDAAQVSLPNGLTFTAPHRHATPGSEAALSLRPERILIGGPQAGVALQGRIEDISYLGGRMLVRLVADGMPLLAAHSGEGGGISVGESVPVSFDPGAARVLGR